MPLTQPDPILHAFAFSASGSYIQTIPDSPTGNAHASWQEGFPPICFTPLASGGSPPFGADFNGVLNALSANAQWLQAGLLFTFQATLSTILSGYPQGALIPSADFSTVWMSKAGGNTHDPATLANIGTYWFPVAGESTVGLIRLAAVSGTGDAIVLTSPINPAPMGGGTAIHQALFFVAGTNNTTAVTVAVDGAAAVALHNNTGGALIADDLVSGTLYQIVYNGTNWQVVGAVPSQVNPVLFATATDVTGSRVVGTTYTNSTGKPMFLYVSITVAAAGGGSTFDFYLGGVRVFRSGDLFTGGDEAYTFLVPAGSTYKCMDNAGLTSTLNQWVEVS